ncbi:hypothetical protein IF188_19805 [Microbacterium sp. NEAU-LLC]|uniref:Uncharacterized protein n=1 Tax=Microbacterium helvum TaxID=2773713 RepID=A0ABR8NW28_9MICO|nr:hypothetical protein [Microbacterium helvum]MBD3943942.1 hypothetical protein [Microbacterium helvum]
MFRRIGFTALALVAALTFSACSPATGGNPDMDAAAIQSDLTAIDGVADAEVGFYNTGAPGRNALSTKLVVDETGLADLSTVLYAAIDVIAEQAPGWSSYEFSVAGLDDTSPTGRRGLNVDDYVTPEQMPYGTLGTSLTLTPDELQQAADS